MPLGPCLFKNKILSPQDKEAIIAKSQEYQKAGLSEKEADKKALREEQDKILGHIEHVYNQLGIQPTPHEKTKKGNKGTQQASTEAPGTTPPGGTGNEQTTQGDQSKAKQFAVARRIEASDANPAIKRGIKEQGDTYIPKALQLTEQEAQDIIDHHGTDKAEVMIKDPANGITNDTRVVIAGKLYETYASAGENVKAVDIAIWAENFLMQAGRAANAGKFWKMITASGEDQIVLTIERQQQAQAENALAAMRPAINKSRDQIEAEIRRLVEKKVQETVGQRLEKAKLITKEKRKEIGDFFDSLKVNTPKGMASTMIVPLGVLPHVWNAAVDVIKTAVLTGADVANAIQSGIDYIKANQTEPFDEQKLRDEWTPKIEAVMPKPSVKASEVNAEAIETPGISGKKKVDLISKVVDAYNEGKLTDKKFDEIYASKLGVKPFSQADRAKIRDLAKMISTAEKFEDELMKGGPENFTRENIAKLKDFREQVKKANDMLSDFAHQPSDVWDTFLTILKGNLMSPISLVSNVFYNVVFQPVRFTFTGGVSMVSYGAAKLAKLVGLKTTLDDKTINLVAAQKGYIQGFWNGLQEGIQQLKTGVRADDKNLREIQSNFNPGKAISRWGDSDRTASQKVNDLVEGTLGWPAEAVFRLLNLGDKPFKRAVELSVAMQLASQKGLKGKEREKFLSLPDPASQEEITKAGQEATFQQSTELTKGIQRGITWTLDKLRSIPVIGGPLKLIAGSQVPYVKTPTNIIAFTVQLALPLPTFLVGGYQVLKGNKQSGARMMAIGVTGLMIQQVALSLFSKGLMTGDDDKEKKKRDFQLGPASPPPNSVNTSAVHRGLLGEGWDTRNGDTWVSYSKMGPTGICFDNYANMYKGRIAEGTGDQNYASEQGSMILRTFSSSFEQSFLYGTSNLLEAVKAGDERAFRNWEIKTIESLGSIAYPNTVASIAKASDEYLRDTKDPDFFKELTNVYKAKGFAGEALSPKVNLWGEKVTGNPEGRNKLAYYLFDPSKFKNVDTTDYRFQLYQAFKKDYDGDWLPSMPQRSISVDGEAMKLNNKQYEELSIDVGQERAALVSSYINSEDWAGQDDKTRKAELKLRYERGLEDGKTKFMIDNGLNVKLKQLLPKTPIELKSLDRQMQSIGK